jgi:hypothetical protein
MLALDADAPKPPAYPFIFNRFKEQSTDKISRDASFPAYPACLVFRFFSRFRPIPQHLCFGEGLFTEACAKPQGGKRRLSHFFHKFRKQHKILGLSILLLPESDVVRHFLASSDG